MRKTFTKYQDTYTLIDSSSRVALYERKTKQLGTLHYEIHLMYVDKNGEEHHPGSSLWGGDIPKASSRFARGWSRMSLEGAREQYDKVVESHG